MWESGGNSIMSKHLFNTPGFVDASSEAKFPFALNETMKMDVVRCDERELVLFDRRPYGQSELHGIQYEELPRVFRVMYNSFAGEMEYGAGVDEFVGDRGQKVQINWPSLTFKDTNWQSHGIPTYGQLSIKTAEIPPVTFALLTHMEQISLGADGVSCPFWDGGIDAALPSRRKEIKGFYAKGQGVGMGV